MVWVKSDELGVRAFQYCVPSRGINFGPPSYLYPSHFAWFGDVVHDVGDQGVARGIAELLALTKIAPSQVYRVMFGVVFEANRHNVGLAVGADSGEAADALGLQVFDL